MAERPQYVDIGPHRYAVVWDAALLDRERVRQECLSMVGLIRYQDCRIGIDPDAVPSQQRRELLHEVLHGILDATGWNAVGPEKPDADDLLVRLDTLLLDTLRRNPHVVAWLTGPREED